MKWKVAGPWSRAVGAGSDSTALASPRRRLYKFAVPLVACLTAASSLVASGTSGAAIKPHPLSAKVSADANYGPKGPVASVGTPEKGGTAYFAEGPDAAPTYIFPFVNAQNCTTVNFGQLFQVLYRPLYWFGNDNSPSLDPSYSIGETPTFSNNDTTVTINLKKGWTWSDGEPVTSRDVEFWMNMMFSEKANWCDYTPGYFPDNVKSVSYPNAYTFVLHLNKSYNPTWFTYNELSQIFPMPIAWDRTSLSAAAPSPTAKNLPDTTKTGVAAVYTFLNSIAKNTTTYAKSPIWSIVDGPWQLSSFSSTGQVTMVPNPKFTGTSPKPILSKFVEVPYIKDQALDDVLKSSGTKAVQVAYLADEFIPQLSSIESEGFTATNFAPSEISYFPLNLHNPTFGPLFNQVYFRQAFAHLVDQPGWISHLIGGYAAPTYGPVPVAPPNALADKTETSNPYPFSDSDAANILKAHGWADVGPGETAYCAKPGTGAGECGKGVKQGLKIAFNLDYISGATVADEEVEDLKSQAAQVGIDLELTTHPFAQVAGAAVDCGTNGSAKPGSAQCNWTAEDWGAGWVFAPDYLPTGESIFYTGAAANYEGWDDSENNKLIEATTTAPASKFQSTMDAWENYVVKEAPVVFIPTASGDPTSASITLTSKHLGGYSNNVFTDLTPETWYLTK